MLREPYLKHRKGDDGEPVRILLLEDDPHFADLLRTQLRRMPSIAARLEVAGTLAEALEKLAAESYGLVLADLNLPDASGLRTVEALARSGEQLIIVLTGIQDPALRAGALEAGAYDFLSKDHLSAAVLERLLRLAAIQATTYRSLRESEARFRGLVELSSDWYWEQDEDLRFTRFEGPSTDIARHALGKRRWEIPGLTPLAGGWQEHRELLEARRPFRDFEYSVAGPDGALRYVNVIGTPVFDALGRFRGYRGLARDTTERKRAEENLRRFRLAMDNSADIILLIDRATMRYADVNLTACRLLGYTREEMLAMGPHDVLPASREDLEKSYDAFIADPEGPAAGMNSHYRCKDGSLLPFESTRRALYSGGKWFIAAISRDIRERIASEREVSQIGRMYAALGAANEAILRAKTPGEIFEHACRIAVEAGGFQIGTVFVMDPQTGKLSRSAASGPAAALVEHLVPPVDEGQGGRGGLIGEACRTGRPAISNDYQDDPRTEGRRSLISSYPVGSGAVFPLHVEGRLAAVFGLQHADRNAFSTELTGLLQRLADDISFALENFQRDDQLLRSEARFRSLANLSSDWYWEQDAELRFTKFEGKGHGEGRHIPAAAVLGKRLWELRGVDLESFGVERYRAQLERHEAFRHFEYSYRDRSGLRFYISADGEPVFDEQGRFSGYRGTSRDITARRRGEEEMRRFRAAMDLSIDAIYLTDRATMRFLDANEAACRGLGYSREQLLSMGPHDVLLTPKHELEQAYDAVIAEGERGLRAEAFYLARDGSKRWTELHRRALRSGDGWIIVTVSRDITGRKRAEERQAVHLHYQEKLSRFGQSALARRQPAELIGEAVQTLLEALGAEAVAYFEPGQHEGEVVLRELAATAPPGALDGVDDAAADPAANPVLRTLRTGERDSAPGEALGLAWARGMSVSLMPVRGESRARGALCVGAKPQDPPSPDALNFVEAMASLLSTGLQRIDSEGRLAYLAQFDPLTGLPNRALLADRFSQMIVQARRHGRPLGVLFIDLDEFKLVNDTLGHAGGDELLKEVAVRLQSAVRAGDTVARISGDEFAVVLADLARPEDAALVAQKIVERLAAPVDVLGQEVFVTASVGIAGFPGDGGDAESLIGAADAAMYRAKQSGRNAFQFFTAEINQRSRVRAQLGAELRRALEREEFALVYQPKFRLSDRGTGGAEALLRWQHPERGTVSPAEFIPVLEETGLIVPVGEWVLRRACEDLKAWRAAGLAAGPVAVNLSARQFRLPDLDVRLKAVVADAGVDPALIELEITESQLMQDPDQAIRVMRSLREAGMRIAIDDFGTGYSSLAYLTRFPVGSLKIDRSFVAGVNEDASAAAIVRTIIEMAHTLGFTVVAEGIETEAQAAYLRRHRCEEGQGYLFARPMSAQDLAALLAKHRP